MPSVGLTTGTTWNVRVNVGLEQSAVWNVADPIAGEDCDAIAANCDIFAEVSVDFMVAGVSRVTWDIKESFAGRRPWSFQLQVGNTANPRADDWTNVGAPVTNAFTASDEERRAFGKQLTTHYRVALTDADSNVYYSRPAIALGGLSGHDWIVAREHIRQETVRLKKFAGIRGYLLKKRRFGAPCLDCLDPYTGDILDSSCDRCKGTRFLHGYYRAIPCQFADLTNASQDEDFANNEAGWSMPTQQKVKGTFVGTVQITTGDIFVDAASDLRYFINVEDVLVRVRGLPVALSAWLEQLEFSDIVYRIPLEGDF